MAAKDFQSQIISHQVYLQRLATQTGGLSIGFVNKMRKEVRDAVNRFGDDQRTVKRLNRLLGSLDEALSDVGRDWKKTIEQNLKDIADYESKWFVHTLDRNTKKDVFIEGPSAEELWSQVKFVPLTLGQKPVGLIDMLDGWTTEEKNRLVRGVQSGFVQGETTRAIVKNVVGAGGLADVSERNAMTVVRTAVNHASTVARNEVYATNNDIVSHYEWVSTLDSRTSAVCRARDKQRYEVGKGPMPPAHPNCRSTTVPIIDDDFLSFLDEGATRASKDGPVDANLSYYDWLRQQPAWMQDEALGPIRGKIFRNSGISPDEFRKISVDGFGRPMTLPEMADADRRVAEYLESMRK